MQRSYDSGQRHLTVCCFFRCTATVLFSSTVKHTFLQKCVFFFFKPILLWEGWILNLSETECFSQGHQVEESHLCIFEAYTPSTTTHNAWALNHQPLASSSYSESNSAIRTVQPHITTLSVAHLDLEPQIHLIVQPWIPLGQDNSVISVF